MRKIVSLLSVLMLFCILAFGQTRTVTGVIRDERGNPVPFATVTESGTSNATTADEKGAFTIKIGQNSRLVVTSSGFGARTITPTEGAQAVTLTRNENLQEVVVTALGIRRKPEEIGYATSTVRPDQITAGRSFNLAQSLSGKVSGLQIQNTSNSVNAAPRITLRGLRSLTGSNTALVVLDGVQVPASTINFINPNDVERVDILKGGQAATLFGSEGVNGAIVITTKKGSQRPEVTVMHTQNIEKVNFQPKFQTLFGSGSAYGASNAENFHPAENQQYGDRYDGSIRPVGRARADGSIMLAPYSYNPSSRDGLWDNGNTGITDFSYRAGDATSNFFASYQNLYSNGIVFGDQYSRNSFRLNAGRTYGKVSLSFDANYVWDHADRTNNDFYYYALNTGSWIPVDQLKDWRNNKFAEMSGYFNDYYNNPWWYKDNQRFDTKNNIFNTNLKLSFKPIQELELTGRVALTTINSTTTTNSNSYTFTAFSRSNAYVNYFNNNYDRLLTNPGRFVARTNLVGGVSESAGNSQRIVGDAFATWNRNFSDFSLKGIVGAQAIAEFSKSSGVSTSGIGIPEFYSLGYSATGLYSGSNSRSEARKLGGFVDVTLGYKGMAYLHGSYRNDATSRFYSESAGFTNPSFSTWGGDVSIIVSDIFPVVKGRVIDAIKLRAAYNENGNDNLPVAGLQRIYPLSGGFPYSGLLGTTVGDLDVASGLVPEKVKTAEVGIEMGLFNNRLAIEAAYYKQNSLAQILDIRTSYATGTPVVRLNAADLDNQGFELDIKANVLRNRDWNINLNGNYSHNTNIINNLYATTGLDRLNLQSSTLLTLAAEKGQMFPYLRTTAFLRDSATGKVIVDPTDGWPLRNDEQVAQGTTQPVHILGLGFSAAWKGLTLIANAEYRGGHVVYHAIGQDMTFTGSGLATALYERETFIWPNSVYRDPSTGKLVDNKTIGVGAYQAMYQGFGDQGFTRGLAGVGESFVSSAAFWKIREISLSYDLPSSILNRVKFVRGISIQAFARNPFVFLPDDNIYNDPEFSNTSGNAQGINTSLNTPPTRQFGGSIKLVF